MAGPKETKTTPAEIRRMAEEARQWVVSPEGRSSIQAGLEIARETSTRIEEAQRVNHDTLQEPYTL